MRRSQILYNQETLIYSIATPKTKHIMAYMSYRCRRIDMRYEEINILNLGTFFTTYIISFYTPNLERSLYYTRVRYKQSIYV